MKACRRVSPGDLCLFGEFSTPALDFVTRVLVSLLFGLYSMAFRELMSHASTAGKGRGIYSGEGLYGQSYQLHDAHSTSTAPREVGERYSFPSTLACKLDIRSCVAAAAYVPC